MIFGIDRDGLSEKIDRLVVILGGKSFIAKILQCVRLTSNE